ncbi:MAG: hypothetical protein M0Z52_02230 [Actinomycetota bacterium]|nr:hypothetical protein [Actinomycetota bacterium]
MSKKKDKPYFFNIHWEHNPSGRLSPSYSAGPPEDRDATEFQNPLGWYDGDTFWGPNHGGPYYHKLEINPYLEYGITKNLTAGVNAYIENIKNSADGSNSGFGDIEVFGRYRLWNDLHSVISAQLLVKVPDAYDHHSKPLLGLGQYDAEGRILYGRWWKWGKHFWFIDAEGAFRKRLGPPADEVRLDWMMGWKSAGEKWEIDFKQENIISLRNNSGVIAADPYQPVNYDLSKATLSALYWAGQKTGLQAGLAQDFYGRNAGLGTMPFLALWEKF